MAVRRFAGGPVSAANPNKTRPVAQRCHSVLDRLNVKPAQLAQIGFIVIAAVVVYAFVATAKDGESRRACTPLCTMRPNYADRNRLAPDFELPNLQGKKVRLSDYRGKVVILNFWTKTCPPCLEELPSFADLAKVLRQEPNMELLTISTDDTVAEARDTLLSVLGAEPPFEVLLDPDSKIVGDKYGTELYPETWFIDPSGVIRARVDGKRDWATALTLDLARSFMGPVACDISLSKGNLSGAHADLCEDVEPG